MKRYAPKPQKHKLEVILEAKSGKDKQKEKVKEFKKIQPFSYAYQDIDITINSIDEDAKGLLKIDIIAEKDGKALDVETDYRFQNPPIKKTNGIFRKETIEGEKVDIENSVVDILGALKEFLGQAIKAQIK